MNPAPRRGHRFSRGTGSVDGREVVVFPPTCYLDAVTAKANKNVALGAQDVCVASRERRVTAVSLPMLKSMPRVDYVLCGHSERRSPSRTTTMRSRRCGRVDASRCCASARRSGVRVGGHGRGCALQLAKALEGAGRGRDGEHCGGDGGLGHRHGAGLPADVAQRVHASIREAPGDAILPWPTRAAFLRRLVNPGHRRPHAPERHRRRLVEASLDAATFGQTDVPHGR